MPLTALLFKFDSILNKFETLFLSLMLNSLLLDVWIKTKKSITVIFRTSYRLNKPERV